MPSETPQRINRRGASLFKLGVVVVDSIFQIKYLKHLTDVRKQNYKSGRNVSKLGKGVAVQNKIIEFISNRYFWLRLINSIDCEINDKKVFYLEMYFL